MTDLPPYAIDLVETARRELHRLPAKVSAAIIEFITGPLAQNPDRLSKPLTNELATYRAARRGDYRVLIRIDEDARAVLVTHIDHRSGLYWPR